MADMGKNFKKKQSANVTRQEISDETRQEVSDETRQEISDETRQEKPDQKSGFKVQWNKKLTPILGYSVFFGVLAVAVGVGLLVCLL